MHTPSKGKSPHIKANLRKCTQTCTALQILLSTSRYSPHQWKPVGSWNRMRNVSKHIPVDYKISGLIWSTCEAVSPESVCVCVRVHVRWFWFFPFLPPLSCCVMFFFLTNILIKGGIHIFSCRFRRFEAPASCFVPGMGWNWACVLTQTRIHQCPSNPEPKKLNTDSNHVTRPISYGNLLFPFGFVWTKESPIKCLF